MNEQILEMQRNFYLTAGCFDQYDRLKPYAILDFFQEIAGIHADVLGIGYEPLVEKGLAWIIVSNRIIIDQNPKASEKVIVKTWPKAPGKVDYERHYSMENEQGEIIARGVGRWCLVDIHSKSINRREKIQYPGIILEKNAIENPSFRLHPISKEESIFSYQHIVHEADLDHYHHTNNAKYADMILNALNLPSSTWFYDYKITHVHEAPLGSKIDIYKKEEENQICLTGYLEDGEICFNASCQLK